LTCNISEMSVIANLALQPEFVLARISRPARIAVLCLAAVVAYAQATGPAAVIEGTVQDLQGSPVVGVSVSLTREQGTSIQTVSTDARGYFRFPALSADTYTLRAKMAGYDDVSPTTFRLQPGEAKRITLTLKKTQAPERDSKSAAMPEFSDAPNRHRPLSCRNLLQPPRNPCVRRLKKIAPAMSQIIAWENCSLKKENRAKPSRTWSVLPK
jgi:hypothetical protein